MPKRVGDSGAIYHATGQEHELASTQAITRFEHLEGEVERIVYSGDETGYTVCRLVAPGSLALVTVVGAMPGIEPGERLILNGRWIHNPKYGLQLQVTKYTSRLPASANATMGYLSSSLVKGIGLIMAGRLADSFGGHSLDIIESATCNADPGSLIWGISATV